MRGEKKEGYPKKLSRVKMKTGHNLCSEVKPKRGHVDGHSQLSVHQVTDMTFVPTGGEGDWEG